MQRELTLDEIVTMAIPSESCPVKNAAAMYRREQLKKRIVKYTERQLENQFNAKECQV